MSTGLVARAVHFSINIFHLSYFPRDSSLIEISSVVWTRHLARSSCFIAFHHSSHIMVWSPADLLWSLTNRAQLTVFESICANLFLALIASLGITPTYNLIRGSQFKPKGKVLFVAKRMLSCSSSCKSDTVAFFLDF